MESYWGGPQHVISVALHFHDLDVKYYLGIFLCQRVFDFPNIWILKSCKVSDRGGYLFVSIKQNDRAGVNPVFGLERNSDPCLYHPAVFTFWYESLHVLNGGFRANYNCVDCLDWEF